MSVFDFIDYEIDRNLLKDLMEISKFKGKQINWVTKMLLWWKFRKINKKYPEYDGKLNYKLEGSTIHIDYYVRPAKAADYIDCKFTIKSNGDFSNL